KWNRISFRPTTKATIRSHSERSEQTLRTAKGDNHIFHFSNGRVTIGPLRHLPACPHRLAWPRTRPFQGCNTGSNPVGDTNTYATRDSERDTSVTARSLLSVIVACLWRASRARMPARSPRFKRQWY